MKDAVGARARCRKRIANISNGGRYRANRLAVTASLTNSRGTRNVCKSTGTSIINNVRLGFVTKYQSYLVLLLIFVIAAIVSPERRGENVFLGSSNLLNVVRFASENGIIAIGMTLVIITAGIDLSVGSVLALCAVTAAYMMMTQDAGIFLTILTVLAVGLGAGLINGVVSTKLRIQPFIVTLAMMSVARGVASLLADGYAIPLAYGDGEGLAPPQFRSWFGGNLEIGGFRIPVSIFYFVAIALIASFVLNRTRFGRHIYAVGGNETASHLSGIKTDRIKIAVYAITGALVGIAALLHAALVSRDRTSMAKDMNSMPLQPWLSAAPISWAESAPSADLYWAPSSFGAG